MLAAPRPLRSGERGLLERGVHLPYGDTPPGRVSTVIRLRYNVYGYETLCGDRPGA
jgi:hypothetical protein